MVKLNSDVVKLNSKKKVQSTVSFFDSNEIIRISCIVAKCWKIAFHLKIDRKRGSLVVSALAFCIHIDPRSRRGKHSLLSFAGMTVDKCAFLQVGTITKRPLCRARDPLCRTKNHTVVYIITCRPSICKVKR